MTRDVSCLQCPEERTADDERAMRGTYTHSDHLSGRSQLERSEGGRGINPGSRHNRLEGPDVPLMTHATERGRERLARTGEGMAAAISGAMDAIKICPRAPPISFGTDRRNENSSVPLPPLCPFTFRVARCNLRAPLAHHPPSSGYVVTRSRGVQTACSGQSCQCQEASCHAPIRKTTPPPLCGPRGPLPVSINNGSTFPLSIFGSQTDLKEPADHESSSSSLSSVSTVAGSMYRCKNDDNNESPERQS